MDIKNLELTEQDFQLLIDGLDALPEKGLAGDIVGELLIGMVCKDDPAAMDKLKWERETKRRLAEIKRTQQIDEIRILQGKLLMLKRWLLQQGALKQANDILEKPIT